MGVRVGRFEEETIVLEMAVPRWGLLLPLLIATTLGLAGAIRLDAQIRPPVAIEGVAGCEGTHGRYVAWLRGADPGLVISSAEFPGARRVTLDERGGLGEADPGLTSLVVTGADAAWALRLPAPPASPEGCLAFDKNRFTWEGDLVSYVRYLGSLLVEAQGLDPSVRTLAVRQRTVALEVGPAGGATKVRLSGPEGAMQGLGRWSDPTRHFFLPVVVGPGDLVLVRILRNRGEAFGPRSTEAVGAVLLSSNGEAVLSSTDPVFELRLVGVSG